MKKEYCYLMYDGKYYKIGKSIHPQKRLKQLKTANPNIEIVDTSKLVDEKDLHNLYKHKNITLEWFDLTNEDVNEIKSLFKDSEAHIKINKIEESKIEKENEAIQKIEKRKIKEKEEEEERKLNLLNSKKYTLPEIFDIENDELKIFHLNKWIDLHNKRKSELDLRVEEALKKSDIFRENIKKELNMNHNPFEYNPFEYNEITK